MLATALTVTSPAPWLAIREYTVKERASSRTARWSGEAGKRPEPPVRAVNQE